MHGKEDILFQEINKINKQLNTDTTIINVAKPKSQMSRKIFNI